MSDKPNEPLPGPGDQDPLSEMNGEDLDSLLAQVDNLTAEVEQEVGALEPAAAAEGTTSVGDAEESAELAREIEEHVRQIEQTVDAGVAEAGEALQAAASADSTDAPGGADAGAVSPVTEEDRLVAEREIAAILDQPAGPTRTESAEASKPVPARTTRWSAVGGVCWRYGVLGLGWMLEQADRPFVNWSAERKTFIGYAALATLFMAAVTCVAAAFFNG